MLKDKLAILVISCDNYRDAWRPFFELLSKFWPDCPFKLYLGTNNENFDYPGVIVLKSESDISWADNYKRYLEQISEEYVLTFLEDFFLCRRVITEQIERALSLVIRDNIDHFRLNDPRKGIGYKNESDIYLLDPKASYCINTSIAIWRKDVLKSFLKPMYSAWDFEIKNSQDVNCLGFFSGKYITTGAKLFYHKNGIIRGKWVQSSIAFCKRNGIYIDTSMRPYMRFSEYLLELFKNAFRYILPDKLRKNIKRVIIRLGFSKYFVSNDY